MSSINSSTRQQGDYIMHGMMCSYFTKKLEAYFLAKGIPYQFVEMDAPDLIQCGDKVGITQLPQVQCPDGSWLTDTTPIIEHFESDASLPRLRPQDPFALRTIHINNPNKSLSVLANLQGLHTLERVTVHS